MNVVTKPHFDPLQFAVRCYYELSTLSAPVLTERHSQVSETAETVYSIGLQDFYCETFTESCDRKLPEILSDDT